MEKKLKRNQEILFLLAIGLSGELVSKMFNISRFRVNQIKRANADLYTELLAARNDNLEQLIDTYSSFIKR